MQGGGGVTVSVNVLKAIFGTIPMFQFEIVNFNPQISQNPKMKRNFATPLKLADIIPFFHAFFHS